MADGSPRQRPGGERRTRRRGGGHAGDRCNMCRRMVVVDQQGRCPLGHQVVSAAEVRGRESDRDVRHGAEGSSAAEGTAPEGRGHDDDRGQVVSSYSEPGMKRPAPPVAITPDGPVAITPDGPVDGATAALATRAVFDDPPPPLPIRQPDGTDVPAEGVITSPPLPVRTRGSTAAEPVARTLFSDALEDSTEPIAGLADAGLADAAPVDAAPVDAGPVDAPVRAEAAGDRVSYADLTPGARSVLDVGEPSWTVPAQADPVAYEQEPLDVDDAGLEPSRGAAEWILGAVFLAVLVGIAWYLAVTL
ncbi:hypothetical protein BH23ACT9_BH23ACT9_22010 [soil metagenome]